MLNKIIWGSVESKYFVCFGLFEVFMEFKIKMKVIMWQLIKGDICIELLFGYNDVRDFGMIFVINLIVIESNQLEGIDNLNEVLEKYKDWF